MHPPHRPQAVYDIDNRALEGDEMERVTNLPGAQGIAVSVLFQPHGVGRMSRPTLVRRTLS